MNRPPRPGTPLTKRERQVVWYAGQGYTYRETGRTLGIATSSVEARAKTALIRLEAASIAQAVFIAVVRGIIGAYIDCGNRAAYLRHLRRHEPTCMACRRGNADHAIVQRAQRR